MSSGQRLRQGNPSGIEWRLMIPDGESIQDCGSCIL